jgi:hypothetical protein
MKISPAIGFPNLIPESIETDGHRAANKPANWDIKELVRRAPDYFLLIKL